ncbi:MAG: arylsulfatase, partial [Candidatus Nealsonbacteria bacterium]|nr:arylsulfatase [Candidatus Nealsonbacteria bacterium]
MRGFIILQVALLCLIHGPAWARQPNVILILTDDQGYGDLGCHGNRVIRTPNLDRLHGQSVRLADFHVSPVCSPTRAALMTGRYPNRVGVWHVVMSRSLLRPDETTVADLFSADGYRTAIFGKWHLGDNYPYRPQDRGFREVLVHGGGVVGHVPDFWLNDYFGDTYLHNGRQQKYPGYCTDVWFDGAIEFIEQSRHVPFFVYLSLNVPHAPYLVPEEYEAPYRDNENVPHAAFYGMIAKIDENVGRLQRELRRLDLEENTILIFMTDNGTARGVRRLGDGRIVGFNAGMRGAKGSQYDGGHRVPCWFHWPDGGLQGGRDVRRIANHVDILPTLLDLCSLKPPEDVTFDGRSLVSLLQGEEANWPDRVLFVELQNVVDRPVKWRRCAVMTDRWRLVDGKQLYDVKADPGQQRNIAAEQPEVVARLRAAYERWWSDVAQRHDETTEIPIGSDRENPVRLTCYHWNNATGNQRDMPWGQAHIVAGLHHNGYWPIRVEQAGTYRFTLRRWPREAALAINDTSDADPPEKPAYLRQAPPLIATRARLKIEDFDATLPVETNAKEVTFTAKLSPGSTRLRTWFSDKQGNARGAYYVWVERQVNAKHPRPQPP